MLLWWLPWLLCVPVGHAEAPQTPTPTQELFDALLNLHQPDAVERVNALLERGADPNVRLPDGGTPLTLLLTTEKLLRATRGAAPVEAVARMLVEKGADVNAADVEGNTPLALAESLGLNDLAIFLRANGASPPKIENLFDAAKLGDLERAQFFLTQGDVNAKDQTGYTPLHWSVTRRHADVARLLLTSGANVNARDKEQNTPLLAATNWVPGGGEGQAPAEFEIVQLLIDKGADVNAKNRAGETALLHAVMYIPTEATKLLLAKGADARTVRQFLTRGGEASGAARLVLFLRIIQSRDVALLDMLEQFEILPADVIQEIREALSRSVPR